MKLNNDNSILSHIFCDNFNNYLVGCMAGAFGIALAGLSTRLIIDIASNKIARQQQRDLSCDDKK